MGSFSCEGQSVGTFVLVTRISSLSTGLDLRCRYCGELDFLSGSPSSAHPCRNWGSQERRMALFRHQSDTKVCRVHVQTLSMVGDVRTGDQTDVGWKRRKLMDETVESDVDKQLSITRSTISSLSSQTLSPSTRVYWFSWRTALFFDHT